VEEYSDKHVSILWEQLKDVPRNPVSNELADAYRLIYEFGGAIQNIDEILATAGITDPQKADVWDERLQAMWDLAHIIQCFLAVLVIKAIDLEGIDEVDEGAAKAVTTIGEQ
jgi:hypothetical protein